MTTAYHRGISLLFCFFLAGLLVWHGVLPDREKSETENRTLARWPAFSWEALRDGSFTEGVEEYFADQFPLRDSWTGLRARSEQLLGKREFHGVFLCGDMLISQVAEPEEAQVRQNLSSVKSFSESTPNVLFGLIPSAAEVWREKLPAGAESWDQTELLAESQVDFQGVLSAHRDEPVFYRTDHHWTTLGAYYGYTALMEALGRGEEVLPRDAFTPRVPAGADAFCGTLYSQSGIHWLRPDTIEIWVEDPGFTVASWRSGREGSSSLYDFTRLEEKDKYSVFLGGNQPLCVIQNESGRGKLLLIRDSYSDALAPFLAMHFQEVHLLDLRYNRSSPGAYAREQGIDEICVLYSAQNFISDRNLMLLRP